MHGGLVGWHSLRSHSDKLLLFLHDHFAISADKVESGALLLTYVQTMEEHLESTFDVLLKAVTFDPVMQVLFDILDADPSDEERAIFAQLATTARLGQALANLDQLNTRIAPTVRGVFAMPSFHMC